jgi:hypothetical protein
MLKIKEITSDYEHAVQQIRIRQILSFLWSSNQNANPNRIRIRKLTLLTNSKQVLQIKQLQCTQNILLYNCKHFFIVFNKINYKNILAMEST